MPLVGFDPTILDGERTQNYALDGPATGPDIIQGVAGGKVKILGGHSIGHSKQNCLYEHVSYFERFPR